MKQPAYIQKTLQIKPEVHKIFDDLEEWLDHCRLNLLSYDPADLYKSKEYKDFIREKNKSERKNKRDYKNK